MKQPKGLSVIEHNGMVLAKLYNTLIVIIDLKAKTVKLDSGTWRTMHTKKCINLVCRQYGINLRQVKGEWLIDFNEANATLTVPFRDGITLSLAA